MSIPEDGALKVGHTFIERRSDEHETETLSDREHNYKETELIEIHMFDTA